MNVTTLKVRSALSVCAFFVFICPFFLFGSIQSQVSHIGLIEENYVLLNVKLDRKIIFNSLDAYHQGEVLFFAVEPLFDILNLKYILVDRNLTVWKDDKEYIFELLAPTINPDKSTIVWGQDDYNIYVSEAFLESLFDLKVTYNNFRLIAEIDTYDYKFPKQKLEELERIRKLNALSGVSVSQEKEVTSARDVTIADQYRFFTAPNGLFNSAISWSEKNKNNNFSVQLVSDLFYHSASLTLGQSNGSELASRLEFSRYKTAPNQRILGMFDKYSFGDVSGSSNSLTSRVKSGLGIVFDRSPENFRRQNLLITINEQAPPGWEAELYHNNRFLRVITVPQDGLLVFEDVPTEYGQNIYQIKLFGPFGEADVIEKYLDLTKNALAKNDIAYNVFALDPNHKLINDKNGSQYEFTDLGMSLDYGISDNWQFGVSLYNTKNQDDEDIQLLSMKNALSFPGFLVENDISVDQDLGFAQLTTITGNLFDDKRFSFAYESASDYESPRINAKESDVHLVNANISGVLSRWSYGLNANFRDENDTNVWRLSNRLSRSFESVYLNHTLDYSIIKSTLDGHEDKINSLTGSLNLGGRISRELRVSAALNYNPVEGDFIQNSSSMLLQYAPVSESGINHYFNLRYLPLQDSDKNWQLGYNVGYDTKQYQLTLSSNYSADERWNIQAGVRFFFGYDHYNSRPIFSSEMTSQSATLDAHVYLDRQLNNQFDPLDYDLSGVEFFGNKAWKGLTTGNSGRVILPGLASGGVTTFGARWKNGSQSIDNDFVVYTHPGSYIKVDIPFHLTTELIGFVLREKHGSQTPVTNAMISLLDNRNELIQEIKVDADGYFEFLGLAPGRYTVKIQDEFLARSGYESEVIGYNIRTGSQAGFIELPAFLLARGNRILPLKNAIQDLQLDANNSEAIINDDTQGKLFHLPKKSPPESSTDSSWNRDYQHKVPNDVKNSDIKMSQGQQSDRPKLKRVLVEVDAKQIGTISNNPYKTISGQVIVDKNALFTLQLGAYSNAIQAEAIAEKYRAEVMETTDDNTALNYKVVTGRFPSKEAALNYGQQHLKGTDFFPRLYFTKATSNETEKNTWVVQFFAGKTLPKTTKFEAMRKDGLFYAYKNINGEPLVCIISKGFKSKNEALVFLNKSALDGFVLHQASFNNIERL
ncbi:MSCRAMM family protein [Pseudoalteromonas ulvae]|uniref:SPOR domain-containing protein n=1 Tax=Pseudoalteromonas ulvae TaxID=107327 RepID=A0A244CTQ2_PSEDV|nr:SPOR domain-containing protein [Pseudoalteromonas ulvae]OUL58609.1 hypothetical protein B1199_09835 [Pseudoalteromonas ulvae]